MNKMKFTKPLGLAICSVSFLLPLYAKEFPGDSWVERSPSELGINASKVERLFDLSFEDDATQSVVLIKDGYLIAERYADGYNKDSIGTSWSMAKSFYASLIGISIERGEIGSLGGVCRLTVVVHVGHFPSQIVSILHPCVQTKSPRRW